MNLRVYKRIIIFIAVLLLSCFAPWQLTGLLLLAAAIFIVVPVEYGLITLGIFGNTIVSWIFIVLVILGLFLRDKIRSERLFI